MYIVAIGWIFVVVTMAVAEADTGAWFSALGTLFGYGVLPLALFLWLVGTPQRRRDRAGRRVASSGASFTRHGPANDEPAAPDDGDAASR